MRSFGSRALWLALCAFLAFGITFDLLAQNPQHKKKKKPTHPKSPACQTGCKPDTASPTLDSAAPEDAALQRDLALLARDVHHGTPGAYEKLAAFASKSGSNV